MTLTNDQLKRIAEEASTLTERRSRCLVATGRSTNEEVHVRQRLDRWRETVAAGSDLRFERRLRWDGLDREAALSVLGTVRLACDSPLPTWTGLLTDAVRTLERCSEPSLTSPERTWNRTPAVSEVFRDDAPLAFQELLWPFVSVARELLTARIGRRIRKLSTEAQADLQRSLLVELCGIADRSLFAEFTAFRTLYRSSHPRSTSDRPRDTRGGSIYSAFIRTMRHGFVRFLLRYPMLARLLASRSEYWIDATGELLTRLDADEPALRSALRVGPGTLRVQRIRAALSDSHNRGRRVSLLHLSSGATVVYKPRSLALDRIFFDLLDLLNERWNGPAFRILRVIDRDTHGWAEGVEAEPCRDMAQVKRFCYRAGGLACLAHALGGSDFHAENLIAHGEQPVLVDLECAIGSAGAEAHGTRLPEHLEAVQGSNLVLGTGFLPVPHPDSDQTFRFSGALADVHRDPPFRRSVWQLTNTDWMTRGHASPGGRVFHAVPRLGGTPIRVGDHVDSVLQGFREMSRVLTSMRGEFLTAGGPLAGLDKEESRVVVQETRVYERALTSACAPRNLVSGANWSIALDVLRAPSLDEEQRPATWGVREAELADLERFDVPIFRAGGHDGLLRTATGEPCGERATGMDGRTSNPIADRLAGLTTRELDHQAVCMRASFRCAEVLRAHRKSRAEVVETGGQGLTRQQLLAEVNVIVELLQAGAVATGRGVTWQSHEMQERSDDVRLRWMGSDLYSGAGGVALFLAAVASVTGESRARTLASGALEALLQRFTAEPDRRAWASEMTIGAGAGIGGVVYALICAGLWLKNEQAVAAARQIARVMTRERIRADNAFDVMSGAAGALLGLLALYRKAGDERALRQATDCGEHLLRSRKVDADTGLRAWQTLDGRMRSGFAHGVSGIAYSLWSLYEVTGGQDFQEAASEAWAFEDTLFLAERRNWCEHRLALEQENSWSWCHGAVGIGMARLGVACGDPRGAGDELESAIAATAARADSRRDDLCCGNLGRAEFLLCAGRYGGREEPRAASRRLARRVVGRAARTGSYGTGVFNVLSWGFFQGLSGIGYALLRLCHPERLPCVLRWE